MKLKPITNLEHKKIRKLLRLVFPVFWVLSLWKCWHWMDEDSHFFRLKEKRNAKKSKKFLGLVGVTSLFLAGKKLFHLKFLAVDPQKQGIGLGAKVIQTLENKAKKSGHDYMFLTSHPKRDRAHKFYLRNGFKRLGGFLFWKKIK